jgi:hypothetical protein
MVREAQRAGLHFDVVKLRSMHCDADQHSDKPKFNIPVIVEPSAEDSSSQAEAAEAAEASASTDAVALANDGVPFDELPEFHRKLHLAATKGTLHDMLALDKKKNYGVGAWAWWQFMEHLPLRRMDLQEDGSWNPISWPLPMGEVRDLPDSAVIHNSVLRRMLADELCRPGNVIVGGGGRGVLVAPSELGIGNWRVLREEGDLVGEVFVRDGRPVGSRHLSKSSGKSKEKDGANNEGDHSE